MAKTLAHELGHAILHDPKAHPDFSRDLAELEAESVAYVVCDGLDIDSSTYSFGYIAGWAGSGERATKAIEASASRINRATRQVFEVLERGMPPVETLSREPVRAEAAKPSTLHDEMTTAIALPGSTTEFPEPLHRGPTDVHSLLLTVPEACEALRIGRSQLYVLANRDRVIHMVHVGRSARIPRASLEAYIERLRAPSMSDAPAQAGRDLS
jgi:excisionase family DNA binding protein